MRLMAAQARFSEFHDVYIEPHTYETYKKTNVLPEGTIIFKELRANPLHLRHSRKHFQGTFVVNVMNQKSVTLGQIIE